jgi:hypothetical protein
MLNMNNPLALLAIGIIVGIYSGIMGLGGGTLMIPIMVLLLGFTQQKAVATSLAVMIPPVTLPAVISYYRNGQVDFTVAVWIAVGVLLGTPLGAYVAIQIADRLGDKTLKLIFGFVLVYVAGYTIFQTLGNLTRSILFAAVMLLAAGVFYGATRLYDSHRQESVVRSQ